jgi:hypothetical protein
MTDRAWRTVAAVMTLLLLAELFAVLVVLVALLLL